MKTIFFLSLVACAVAMWIGWVSRFGTGSSNNSDDFSQALAISYTAQQSTF